VTREKACGKEAYVTDKDKEPRIIRSAGGNARAVQEMVWESCQREYQRRTSEFDTLPEDIHNVGIRSAVNGYVSALLTAAEHNPRLKLEELKSMEQVQKALQSTASTLSIALGLAVTEDVPGMTSALLGAAENVVNMWLADRGRGEPPTPSAFRR
jgi:hypothetical protein